MTDDMDIAAWIREELKARGWTVRELARRSDLYERDLYRWMAGQSPMPQALAAIMEAFGYEVPWVGAAERYLTTRVLFDSIMAQSA